MTPIEIDRLELDGMSGKSLELRGDVRTLRLSVLGKGRLYAAAIVKSTVICSAVALSGERVFLNDEATSLCVVACYFDVTRDEATAIRAWLAGALRPAIPDTSDFHRADAGAAPAPSAHTTPKDPS